MNVKNFSNLLNQCYVQIHCEEFYAFTKEYEGFLSLNEADNDSVVNDYETFLEKKNAFEERKKQILKLSDSVG